MIAMVAFTTDRGNPNKTGFTQIYIKFKNNPIIPQAGYRCEDPLRTCLSTLHNELSGK